MYESVLKPDYEKNRDSLETNFNTAYEFLKRLEKSDSGRYLGTDVNAHFYLRDRYLGRIEFGQTQDPHIILKKEYLSEIKEGTRDRSGLLFPTKIIEIINKYSGFKDKWAYRDNEGSIFLFDNTPKKFFYDIIEYIDSLVKD